MQAIAACVLLLGGIAFGDGSGGDAGPFDAELSLYEDDGILEALLPRRQCTLTRLRYRSTLEDMAYGILALPNHGRAGSWPLVLMLHHPDADKRTMTRRYAGPLAQAGIASLSLDLPGHGERTHHGDIPQDADMLAMAAMDMQRALTWAESYGKFDMDRVGLITHDWGLPDAVTHVLNRHALSAVAAVSPHGAPLSPFRLQGPGRPRILVLLGERDQIVSCAEMEARWIALEADVTVRKYASGHFLPAQAEHDLVLWMTARLKHPDRGEAME